MNAGFLKSLSAVRVKMDPFVFDDHGNVGTNSIVRRRQLL